MYSSYIEITYKFAVTLNNFHLYWSVESYSSIKIVVYASSLQVFDEMVTYFIHEYGDITYLISRFCHIMDW